MTLPTKTQEPLLHSPLLMVLDELGYFVEGNSLPKVHQDRLHSVPFDVATLAGLYIHSQLSQHRRMNWYANGETIWYPGAPRYKLSDEKEDIKNAVREYVIAQIIQLAPQEEDIYDRVNYDLRLADFSGSFSQYKTQYHKRMEELAKAHSQIVAYEHHEIKVTRLERTGELVDRFIAACERDESAQEIAEILTKNLARYLVPTLSK